MGNAELFCAGYRDNPYRDRNKGNRRSLHYSCNFRFYCSFQNRYSFVSFLVPIFSNGIISIPPISRAKCNPQKSASRLELLFLFLNLFVHVFTIIQELIDCLPFVFRISKPVMKSTQITPFITPLKTGARLVSIRTGRASFRAPRTPFQVTSPITSPRVYHRIPKEKLISVTSKCRHRQFAAHDTSRKVIV